MFYFNTVVSGLIININYTWSPETEHMKPVACWHLKKKILIWKAGVLLWFMFCVSNLQGGGVARQNAGVSLTCLWLTNQFQLVWFCICVSLWLDCSSQPSSYCWTSVIHNATFLSVTFIINITKEQRTAWGRGGVRSYLIRHNVIQIDLFYGAFFVISNIENTV